MRFPDKAALREKAFFAAIMVKIQFKYIGTCFFFFFELINRCTKVDNFVSAKEDCRYVSNIPLQKRRLSTSCLNLFERLIIIKK